MTVIAGASETAGLVAAINATALQCGLKQQLSIFNDQQCLHIESTETCKQLQRGKTSRQQDSIRHVFQITASARQQQDLGSAVLLQGFGWESCRQHHSTYYEYVHSKVPDLQAAGITHVWLPPPSHSVSPEGYMPGQLYDLTSAYGSKEQLEKLIGALKAAGISPVADIVINHRCADEQDERGRWNKYKDTVPHEGPSLDWGSWAIVPDDGTFGGDGQPPADKAVAWLGAPNLDHSNSQVREGLTAWLAWLQQTLGFEGWRFDHAIGYSSKYVQSYVDRTTGPNALNVGEVWVSLDWSGPGGSLSYSQDAARSQLVDWVQGCGHRASVFDFVTKGVLQEAVKKCEYWRLKDAHGLAPGLIGWWPAASITFVENHDTGSSQQMWPFPADRLALGYAYILTHPGLPCVFWEHYASSTADPKLKDTIATLLKLRRKHGITSTSSMTITCAESDLYVAVISGKLTVKLGPRYDMGHLLPSDSQWQIAAHGQDFCVWELRDNNAAGGCQAGGFQAGCMGSSV